MEHNKLRHQLWACLKAEWISATPLSLAQLSAEEWEQLFTLARQQGVLPLLLHRLQSAGQSNHIPPLLAQRMQELVCAATVRNLRLYHELGMILTALRSQNLPVIVLKGAHLAATVYPDQALRSMNDIDLLFHPADAPAAVAALQKLGYQPSIPIVWANHLDTDHHLPRFGKPDVVAGVEIHWTLTQPEQAHSIDQAGLWMRATPVTLGGVEVLGLCPEDLLLHICEHTTYHHQFSHRTRSLCDIDAVVRHFSSVLDWEQVQQRAKAYGWAKGIHLALLLAQQVLATPVPSTVLQHLQADDFAPHLLHLAIEQCFADYATVATIFHEVAQLAARPTWSEKAQIVGRRLWPPPQTLARIYGIPQHSPKLYGYYLVRYRDLLLRYSGKLWRLWRKDPTLQNETKSNLELADKRSELLEWFERA